MDCKPGNALQAKIRQAIPQASRVSEEPRSVSQKPAAENAVDCCSRPSPLRDSGTRVCLSTRRARHTNQRISGVA
jgi:hypothetical protein